MKHFMPFRLSLVQKMIVSLSVNGICLTVALLYAVTGMDEMHRLEQEIARKDLAAATATISLRESLMAQERAIGKYLILREQLFQEIFDKNSRQFQQSLQTLRQVYQGDKLAPLELAYAAYLSETKRVFFSGKSGTEVVKQLTYSLELALDEIKVDQQQLLMQKLELSDRKVQRIVRRSMLLTFVGVFVSFGVALLFILSFASSIGKLQKAIERISDGDFDFDPGIPPGDEIGAVADGFTRMAARLKEMEQISLDASPLTRLPGNIAIERHISQRLHDRQPFAVCYLDLDNFKSYNDRYGYIRASELIRETGRVIYEVVQELDDAQAFVGHVGGDDFVVIISADRAEQTCQSIIKAFDALTPEFYSVQDLKSGAIEGIDRYGVHRVFPLITISVSVLICEPGVHTTAAEIATETARLKEQLKRERGSTYRIVRSKAASNNEG